MLQSGLLGFKIAKELSPMAFVGVFKEVLFSFHKLGYQTSYFHS